MARHSRGVPDASAQRTTSATSPPIQPTNFKKLKFRMISLYSVIILLYLALLVLFVSGSVLPSLSNSSLEISFAGMIVTMVGVIVNCRLIEMFARNVVKGSGERRLPEGINNLQQQQVQPVNQQFELKLTVPLAASINNFYSFSNSL